MKLAAIVVWYNPLEIGEEKIVQNIISYASYCEKIYIVDNSSNLNEELAKKIPNSIYISNKNIGGIAGGQNRGCEKALEDGFEWAMTMDQDSIFEPTQIKKYIELVESYILTKNDASSFSLRIKNLNESNYWTYYLRKKILGPLKYKILRKKRPTPPDIEFPTEVIASANIIKLKDWKLVNGFDEFLFIEQVDYDFCHKLKKLEKKIVRFNTPFFNQYFGEKVFSLLRKYYPYYGDFRMYYTFRNLFIERYRFPEYKKKYTRIIRIRLFDYCVNTIHPIKHIKICIKCYKDYKKYIREYLKNTF